MKYLIVVDMQNDFVYGALGTEEARSIVPNIESKIRQYADGEGVFFRFTCDTHFGDYLETQEGKRLPVSHCIIGSNGWNIIPELIGYSKVYGKAVNKIGFGYDDWDHEFGDGHGIESFELVGVCTDICVVSNALILKSLYPEIEIIVDASCCAGTTPENHRAALQVMKSCQINIINE